MSTEEIPAGQLPRMQRILVSTDFSAQARMAMHWARHFSEAFGAKLILLHVIDIFSVAEVGCVMGGIDPLHLLREQAQKCMTELKALIPDAESVIREASPRPAIVDAAVELDCQMIVMGTHGRSGLAHLLLGSVAEYVVRHSTVPVLTVRSNTRGTGQPKL